MKKGGGSESTIIIGPSKSVLVYALHSLEYVLGVARFREFVPKLYYYIIIYSAWKRNNKQRKNINNCSSFAKFNYISK